MLINIAQIVAMTRIAMNRNPPSRPLLSRRDPDELRLDTLITSRIEAAAAEVYRTAPLSQLIDTAVDLDDDTIYWHQCIDSLYSGHIRLPDDYLRFVVFEMSDWHHPVHEALTPESAYFEAAAARYSGARGTPSRPSCLICQRAIGTTLEFHSCRTDTAQIVQAKYLPYPRIQPGGAINLDPRSLPALIESLRCAP